MEIKIWGSRGDMPATGASFRKYGGDTTCVEVRLSSGLSIIFDAGSGLVAYDKGTPTEKKSRIFCFTHSHYDHMQGMPFFSGIFNRKSPLVIFGPTFDKDYSFKAGLENFFDGQHTPFKWAELANHEVREIRPGEKFELFGAFLETCPTLHPGGCMAWKITDGGWTFALTGDHEIPLDRKDSNKSLWNERLMGFLAGSDVVLADGHFKSEHHASRPGVGHSAALQWQKELADREVGKICFTHFHPSYSDKDIDELLAEAKTGPIPCEAVYDGAVIDRHGLVKAPEAIECPSCGFSRKVAGFSDTHSILNALLGTARNLANAEGGTVYLLAGGELNFAAAQNDKLFPDSSASKFTYFNARLPVNKSSIAGYVAATGEILNIEDVYKLPENSEFSFNSELDISSGYHTSSVLAVPLANGQGKTVGVLQLINSRGFNGYAPFDDTMAADVASLAQMATIPLERSFLVVSMILRMLKTAALRDPAETSGHVQRVGSVAAELYHYWADQHDVDPEEMLFTKGQLRLAAMLHDIGKVGVPDAILNKPGKLTDHERAIMEKHSFLGASLFGQSEHIIDKMAKDIALHHHARWDGAGYTGRRDLPSPNGENIPIWARITAIADVFDALVSPRPYRKVWTRKEAVGFLRQEAGKQFDPELIDYFRHIMDTVQMIYDRFPDDGHKK